MLHVWYNMVWFAVERWYGVAWCGVVWFGPPQSLDCAIPVSPSLSYDLYVCQQLAAFQIP